MLTLLLEWDFAGRMEILLWEEWDFVCCLLSVYYSIYSSILLRHLLEKGLFKGLFLRHLLSRRRDYRDYLFFYFGITSIGRRDYNALEG